MKQGQQRWLPVIAGGEEVRAGILLVYYLCLGEGGGLNRKPEPMEPLAPLGALMLKLNVGKN